MKRFAVVLGIVGIVLFLLGHVSFVLWRLQGLGMICIVIAGVILVAFLTRQGTKTKKQTQAEGALTAQGYKYVAAAPDGSAIGLDAVRRQIFLRDGQQRSKEYSFDDIRSWRIHLQETGKTEVIPGGSFGQQMGALGIAHRANRDAARIDREMNGLFLRVRDIDTPEWHVALQSHSEQSRWHEILTQYVNEGAD